MAKYVSDSTDRSAECKRVFHKPNEGMTYRGRRICAAPHLCGNPELCGRPKSARQDRRTATGNAWYAGGGR